MAHELDGKSSIVHPVLSRECKALDRKVCIDLGTCKGSKLLSPSPSVNSISPVEVTPIEYRHGNTKMMLYSRVKVELITREILVRIYQLLNLKSNIEVKVLETPLYYIVQYSDKCPILINKKSGRLHVIKNLGYPKEIEEHQASILLSILNRHGMVADFSTRRISIPYGRNLENKEK